MNLGYVVRRLFIFVLVVWVGMTLIFFLPKAVPGRDPIMERMTMLAATGGIQSEGIKEMVDAYRAKFGLDQSLWVQYVNYLGNMFRFDFNYSLAQYPTKVIDLIRLALPWTIGLLSVSTILSFIIGSLAGGLLGWPKTPKAFHYILSPFLLMSSVPYYLVGILLIYVFAFLLKLFPIGGGSQYGTLPSFSLPHILDLLHHSILPAASIVLVSIGGWALAMRGMMITTLGEDYDPGTGARIVPATHLFLVRHAQRFATADDVAGPVGGDGPLWFAAGGSDLSLPGNRICLVQGHLFLRLLCDLRCSVLHHPGHRIGDPGRGPGVSAA